MDPEAGESGNNMAFITQHSPQSCWALQTRSPNMVQAYQYSCLTMPFHEGHAGVGWITKVHAGGIF